MSPRSKREYIEAIFLRYKKASRGGKTGLKECPFGKMDTKEKIAIEQDIKKLIELRSICKS